MRTLLRGSAVIATVVARPPSRARVGPLLSTVGAALIVLALAACSGGSAASGTHSGAAGSNAAGPNATTSGPSAGKPMPAATPTQSAAKPGPAPTPQALAGYSYAAADPAMLTQARALAARHRQFVNATTVKEVVHNGKRVGVLIMLGVDPKFAGNAVFQQQSVVGLAGELAGTSPKIAAQVFGAHKVTTAVAGGQVAAWYANKQIVLLLAQPNLAAAQGFLAVYPIPTGKNSTLG